MKLYGAQYLNINGKNSVCIPVDENPCIFAGRKGIYLNLCVMHLDKPDTYGNTDMIICSVEDKAVREAMTETERRAKAPIIGNLKELVKGVPQQFDNQPKAIDLSGVREIGDLPL